MNADTLVSNKQWGLMLELDIRGYEAMQRQVGADTIRAFMSAYSEVVDRIVSAKQGVIHGVIKGSHIISFGLMEKEVDLSDIPGLELENEKALQNKQRYFSSMAFSAIEEVNQEFEKIKARFKINLPIRVGSGIATGLMTPPAQNEVKLFSKGNVVLDILNDLSKFFNLFSPGEATWKMVERTATAEYKIGVKPFLRVM